ncbi:MAG: hypothetical protein WD669_08610 [Pirellulales bacterium]
MWCSTCQQDMPGFAHSVSGRIVCSRCHQPMRAKKPTHATGICDGGIALDTPVTAAACAAPPKLDDWKTRQRARLLSRELRRPTATASQPFEQMPRNPRRFDPPTDLLDNSASSPPATAETPVHHSSGSQLVSWMIVVFGVLTLASGLGAIAWSLAADRGDLWNQALGLTLAGQGMLIFGLVLVVSRLWRSSRYASGKLQVVHRRLGQLQRTAEGLGSNRGGAATF